MTDKKRTSSEEKEMPKPKRMITSCSNVDWTNIDTAIGGASGHVAHEFVLDLVHKGLLDAEAVTKLKSAGFEMSKIAKQLIFYSFSASPADFFARRHCLPDDVCLLLLGQIEGGSVAIPRTCKHGCNLYVDALKCSSRISDVALNAVAAHFNGELRWGLSPWILADFSAKMAGKKIFVGDTNVTHLLHNIFAEHANIDTVNEKVLDALVLHYIKLGVGLGWLKDWCQSMLPRGYYDWLVRTVKKHARGDLKSLYDGDQQLFERDRVVFSEWLEAANKFDPSSNQWAAEAHQSLLDFLAL